MSMSQKIELAGCVVLFLGAVGFIGIKVLEGMRQRRENGLQGTPAGTDEDIIGFGVLALLALVAGSVLFRLATELS